MRKEIGITVNDDDFGTLCMCAVRYSLGRGSYMPSLVMDIIRPCARRMSDTDLCVISRDVHEQLDYKPNYLTDYDMKEWAAFAEYIDKEMERRKDEVS